MTLLPPATLVAGPLPPEGLLTLSQHKYKGGEYTWLDNQLNKWWNTAIHWMPMWLAPNLITLLGTIAMIATAFVARANMLVVEGKHASGLSSDAEATGLPAWVHAYIIASLFFYQTMDALDGKQARRTGNSTPLGQLFDHGCDALVTAICVHNISLAFGMGNTFSAVLLLVTALTVFYAAQWEERVTHTLRTQVNGFGVSELQCMNMLLHAAGAAFPVGFWSSRLGVGISLNGLPAAQELSEHGWLMAVLKAMGWRSVAPSVASVLASTASVSGPPILALNLPGLQLHALIAGFVALTSMTSLLSFIHTVVVQHKQPQELKAAAPTALMSSVYLLVAAVSAGGWRLEESWLGAFMPSFLHSLFHSFQPSLPLSHPGLLLVIYALLQTRITTQTIVFSMSKAPLPASTWLPPLAFSLLLLADAVLPCTAAWQFLVPSFALAGLQALGGLLPFLPAGAVNAALGVVQQQQQRQAVPSGTALLDGRVLAVHAMVLLALWDYLGFSLSATKQIARYLGIKTFRINRPSSVTVQSLTVAVPVLPAAAAATAPTAEEPVLSPAAPAAMSASPSHPSVAAAALAVTAAMVLEAVVSPSAAAAVEVPQTMSLPSSTATEGVQTTTAAEGQEEVATEEDKEGEEEEEEEQAGRKQKSQSRAKGRGRKTAAADAVPSEKAATGKQQGGSKKEAAAGSRKGRKSAAAAAAQESTEEEATEQEAPASSSAAAAASTSRRTAKSPVRKSRAR